MLIALPERGGRAPAGFGGSSRELNSFFGLLPTPALGCFPQQQGGDGEVVSGAPRLSLGGLEETGAPGVRAAAIHTLISRMPLS